MNKFCKRCSTEKPIEMFTKNFGTKDGYHPWCKLCNRVYNRELEKKRKDTPQYKARRIKNQRAYEKRNPDKVKAHTLASAIPLPELCEDCGKVPPVHRHHPDYAKPLEVVALCTNCHELAHHGALI